MPSAADEVAVSMVMWSVTRTQAAAQMALTEKGASQIAVA
jgi:hypothetical protein